MDSMKEYISLLGNTSNYNFKSTNMFGNFDGLKIEVSVEKEDNHV